MFDTENLLNFTLKNLKTAEKIGLSKLYPKPPQCITRRVMGISFPNPVGLAAGIDKNGETIDGLAALGFGFIEVGTVTPRYQAGHPKPRIFRYPKDKAVINHLGTCNNGVDALLDAIAEMKYKGVLGVSIGKNAMTNNDQAVHDYLYCMRRVYARAHYIAINISSPNTKSSYQMHDKTLLSGLLAKVKREQMVLTDQYGKYVPVVIKISPDLFMNKISDLAALLLKYKMDGVIATNSTSPRSSTWWPDENKREGGLSGAPLCRRSTHTIQQLATHLDSALPIIGVGGIMSGEDAKEKMDAGASLVQLCSGLLCRGPQLIREVCRTLG